MAVEGFSIAKCGRMVLNRLIFLSIIVLGKEMAVQEHLLGWKLKVRRIKPNGLFLLPIQMSTLMLLLSDLVSMSVLDRDLVQIRMRMDIPELRDRGLTLWHIQE